MKNILKSAFALLLFSFSILIFQISCEKEISANTNINNSSNSTDLILFLKLNSNNKYEIWSADGNGGNQKYIPVSLPSGYNFSFGDEGGQLKLSPSKTTIYFTASNSNSITSIFSSSITGTNVTKIIDGCAFNYDVQ